MALVQMDSWLGPRFLEGGPTGLADRLDVRQCGTVCQILGTNHEFVTWKGVLLSGGLEKAVWGCGLSDVKVLKSASYAATVHPFKGQSCPNLEYRSSKAPSAPQAAGNEGGADQGQRTAGRMSPCYRSEV